ncbi:HDOD domain-containing protein [Vibrio nitrifigilis]|uniref:HDOD domain-containing protein n=1 Tax=Vibrio nitrifigilis TaxID=2789781 RepID=A0ABS0GMX6_9VIBR|nr:HDOD domain-containing protein [Vibrio nitrifigilis]
MCQIIQIANNAIFRGKSEINSVEGALNRLGTQIVVNIVAMLELMWGININPVKR